jgi:vacuolar-type H+-ATPase subunit C/Vma6
MTRRWEDLNARAHGLRTHLLARRDLEALARCADPHALADGLRSHGFVVAEDGVTPESLELAVRRHAAQALAILGRWCGPRADAAAILFEDEDRRSLRTLLRGAAEHADPERRSAGAIPTPNLPERALQELARQPTPRTIAALLVAWRHPFGTALLTAASQAEPDLLRLELALNAVFARRAVQAAGTGPLAPFVRETIDLENAFAALVLAQRDHDLKPKDAFIPGGRHLGMTAFEEAAASGSGERAAARLARAFKASPLAAVFRGAGSDSTTMEERALRLRIAEQRHAARLDPLGPAAMLGFVLALRAQTMDLQRVIWGLALGAPPNVVNAELVSV